MNYPACLLGVIFFTVAPVSSPMAQDKTAPILMSPLMQPPVSPTGLPDVGKKLSWGSEYGSWATTNRPKLQYVPGAGLNLVKTLEYRDFKSAGGTFNWKSSGLSNSETKEVGDLLGRVKTLDGADQLRLRDILEKGIVLPEVTPPKRPGDGPIIAVKPLKCPDSNTILPSYCWHITQALKECTC